MPVCYRCFIKTERLHSWADRNFDKKNSELKSKKNILKSIPGIGEIVANELLALLPELSYVNRKQITSLVELAPRANDSRKFRGYRSAGYGRSLVSPYYFYLSLKAFYDNLIAKGKKMVVLIALSRKISLL